MALRIEQNKLTSDTVLKPVRQGQIWQNNIGLKSNNMVFVGTAISISSTLSLTA